MKKVIFWDFDGTLVKQTPKWSDALSYALEKCGYNISNEKILCHIDKGFTWHTPNEDYVGQTGEKWWQNLFKHLEKFYIKNNISNEKFDELNMYYKDYIINKCEYELYDKAVFVLESCIKKGYDNYILSNNFPDLDIVLDRINIKKYFKDYIISANLGYEKPRIEIFEYALELAEKPILCYMVGDNPIADIEGAKQVDMTTILVHKKISNNPDYFCNTLSEILDIV